MPLKRLALSCILALLATAALAATPVLARNAPKDKPARIQSTDPFEKAIAPYVAQARATYPQARERFLAGLPKGQLFFLTTRIKDRKGNVAQTFIEVKAIQNGIVTGRISNDLIVVEGFRQGDTYAFPEREMIDWTIVKPDGSEEGNFVGKFLDTYDGK